jgi:hypothetical protein
MRIRLEPDGLDKYKVILPGKNVDYPIGVVFKDLFSKKGWKIKAYFITMYKDDHIINQIFDDSMAAARALAVVYGRIGTSREITDQFDFIWPDDTAAD